jgi:hypothetical protein
MVKSSAGQTTITGTLAQSVSPNSTFRIEFFASDPDPLGGLAEGQQYLGFFSASTDASGVVAFAPTLPLSLAVGRIVTATATDQFGNTSEFSKGVAGDTIFTDDFE